LYLYYYIFNSFFFYLVCLYINIYYYFFTLSIICINSILKFNWCILYLYFIVFLVKIPLYPYHLWLLKIHLESPYYCSIILASIILKLGIYGLIRFIPLLSENGIYFYSGFYRLIGSILISIYCISLWDYKLLVANSSVVHIVICFLGCIHIRKNRLLCSCFIIVRHGFCSSALFYICNILYKCCLSRTFNLYSGLYTINPYIRLWLLVFSLINISLPPIIRYFVEFQIFIFCIDISLLFFFFLVIFSFFCRIFCIFLYYILILKESIYIFSFYIIKSKDHLILILHLIPLLFFLYFFWLL